MKSGFNGKNSHERKVENTRASAPARGAVIMGRVHAFDPLMVGSDDTSLIALAVVLMDSKSL